MYVFDQGWRFVIRRTENWPDVPQTIDTGLIFYRYVEIPKPQFLPPSPCRNVRNLGHPLACFDKQQYSRGRCPVYLSQNPVTFFDPYFIILCILPLWENREFNWVVTETVEVKSLDWAAPPPTQALYLAVITFSLPCLFTTLARTTQKSFCTGLLLYYPAYLRDSRLTYFIAWK